MYHGLLPSPGCEKSEHNCSTPQFLESLRCVSFYIRSTQMAATVYSSIHLHLRNKSYRSLRVEGSSYPGMLQEKLYHIMTCELEMKMRGYCQTGCCNPSQHAFTEYMQ